MPNETTCDACSRRMIWADVRQCDRCKRWVCPECWYDDECLICYADPMVDEGL
jgi:hypothetical protein